MTAMHSAPHRIVIAEDEPAIAELITTRLELAGYQTFLAKDGYQAVERLGAVSPAALVLDINMPGLDGFGVLKEVARRRIHLPAPDRPARLGALGGVHVSLGSRRGMITITPWPLYLAPQAKA